MMISKTALLLMYNVHKDRSIILRPDSLFCRTIDTSTNTVSTIRYIDIKCNQLPVDLILNCQVKCNRVSWKTS